MRSLCVILVLLVCRTVGAEDVPQKVKVALALAAASQCGDCRFDEAACRTEAVLKNKPLVLFVGGPDHCRQLSGTGEGVGGGAFGLAFSTDAFTPASVNPTSVSSIHQPPAGFAVRTTARDLVPSLSPS